jgi:hypothetical protein
MFGNVIVSDRCLGALSMVRAESIRLASWVGIAQPHGSLKEALGAKRSVDGDRRVGLGPFPRGGPQRR